MATSGDGTSDDATPNQTNTNTSTNTIPKTPNPTPSVAPVPPAVSRLPVYPQLVGGVFLVTGGTGFVGRSLTASLLANGASCIHSLDIIVPQRQYFDHCVPPITDDQWRRIIFHTGSIARAATLDDVVQQTVATSVALTKARSSSGAMGVFHVASFGMSGRDMMASELIKDVNINGTRHVLRACRKWGIKCLVYTSTTNVIFSGRPLANKDESEPYAKPSEHVDLYSSTKTIAEQLVLAADTASPLRNLSAEANRAANMNDDEWHEKSDRVLATCAIRPAGIYGVGEERHFARFLQTLQRGLFVFTIGSPDTLVEFVAIDNLVHAHMLAMHRLFASIHCGAANSSLDVIGADITPLAASPRGRAYFISDCRPINNWTFFRTLTEGLGYKFPGHRYQRLPFNLVYGCAWLVEMTHRVSVGVFGYNFQPLLVRAEVNKTSVTHYFSCDRARAELGYRPVIPYEEAMSQLVAHQQRTAKYVRRPSSARTPVIIGIVLVMALMVIIWLFIR